MARFSVPSPRPWSPASQPLGSLAVRPPFGREASEGGGRLLLPGCFCAAQAIPVSGGSGMHRVLVDLCSRSCAKKELFFQPRIPKPGYRLP